MSAPSLYSFCHKWRMLCVTSGKSFLLEPESSNKLDTSSSGASLQYPNLRYKIRVLTAVMATLCIAIITLIYFRQLKQATTRQHMVIAVPGFQSSALIILAHSMEYFQKQGLDVDLEFRSTGFECLQMVLQGKADLAVAYETPITNASTVGHQLEVLTEIHHSDANTAIVVKKVTADASLPDLIGRKIGFVPKTNAEFLLELYFNTHMYDLKKSRLKEYKISELVLALKSGEVDAAALWEPYVSMVMNENPNNFTILRTSFYTEFSMVVGLREKIDHDQGRAEAVLKALLQAQNYFDQRPDEAQAAVDKVLVNHSYYVASQPWKQMTVQLGLSHTLLTMLEQESKWSQIKSGTTNSIPMKTILQGNILKTLAPDRVTFE